MTQPRRRAVPGSDYGFGSTGLTRVDATPRRWPTCVLTISSALALNNESPADLLRVGIELHPYSDGTAALLALSDEEPSAIVAPTDMEGVNILRFVDAVGAWSSVPIIVGVGADVGSHETAFHALEHGARALIALPFTSRGLADVLHQLGAFGPHRTDPALFVTLGPITLDPQSFRVTVENRLVALTPREFQLMKYLMHESPRVVSIDELCDGHGVYGDGSVAGTRVALLRLRKKLAAASPDAAAMLETVRTLGYRIAEPL